MHDIFQRLLPPSELAVDTDTSGVEFLEQGLLLLIMVNKNIYVLWLPIGSCSWIEGSLMIKKSCHLKHFHFTAE